MSYTLLEIVQEILSDLDSDQVNSIEDTTEALQVASIVRSTYMAMVSNRNWPHLKKTFTFTNSGSTDYPTHLKVPDKIKEVVFINYNCVSESDTGKRNYTTLKYLDNESFLRRQNNLNSNATNVAVVTDYSGVEFLITNDANPEYYTSFDDEYIVCNSYNADIEDTLVGSKTQVSAYYMPTFTVSDTFVPNLPEEAFTALIESAKSAAAVRIRQAVDQKAEQEAQRQQRWLSRKAWRVQGGIKYPNYGRKSRK